MCVSDPTSTFPDGLIEIKCPYSKCEMTPEEACADHRFCCELVDSEIRLKSSHVYYHQLQLQVYVSADLYRWCDFCIYTCKGLSVQRIYCDIEWQATFIPQLETYFETSYLKFSHRNINLFIFCNSLNNVTFPTAVHLWYFIIIYTMMD